MQSNFIYAIELGTWQTVLAWAVFAIIAIFSICFACVVYQDGDTSATQALGALVLAPVVLYFGLAIVGGILWGISLLFNETIHNFVTAIVVAVLYPCIWLLKYVL